MADGGHRLARFHRLAREIDHRVAQPHLVRCVAARDDQRIEVAHPRLPGRQVRGDRGVTPLSPESSALGRADDGDIRACRPQRVERSGELAVLELVFDEIATRLPLMLDESR